MTIVTRFAPSPTGFLHIGSARTALFNWLFARGKGGKFLLRIEDTDQERSTPQAVDAIFKSMNWLELDWDGEVVYQMARSSRHAEVAREMLAKGNAYYCYCSPEELEEMRAKAQAEGRQPRYDGTWRNRDPKDAPAGVKPVIRLKAPQTGTNTIHDEVQGEVTVSNEQLDDMILLRSDGTPTYNLAVVVDDHDMNITHVIRGDDHLNNAFRQYQIYKAMDWKVPSFSHIPLIHGPDGAKLSKRHGALGVEAYRDMGYLPEAMRNYLLRLGWGHGDTEIVSMAEAQKIFSLSGIGQAPSRLDFDKLNSVNAHYIQAADDQRLLNLTIPHIESELGTPLNDFQKARLLKGMKGLKPRAKTILELAKAALFYVRPLPLPMDEPARAAINDNTKPKLQAVLGILQSLNDWSVTTIELAIKDYLKTNNLKLGDLGPALRAALTGTLQSPALFEVMEVLGREEVQKRLQAA
ncbi:MAG: glutamate--tRNA ligase [Alphaproteobacteria bacterium]|nr:MAG: glutamate--tRNA ligase [Alphaproteobacteria bacterium]